MIVAIYDRDSIKIWRHINNELQSLAFIEYFGW